MEYCALYRKYRPNQFEEIAGQNKIKKVLINSIKNGKISHAYLFYGPKGTGKTTIAKLLAKVVNCFDLQGNDPCGKCASCISVEEKSNTDIVEIDAASNNGVDEIREIRSKISFMPSISKYRVYIVDEVHMLTTGAFNALLKTLEEPPAHVIFILATTEYHKVPQTIISRCQCFEFERIPRNDIIERLKTIARLEKIKIDSESLELISRYCDGALRDAIGMLDKLSLYTNGNIKEEDFYRFRGIANATEIDEIISLILNGNIVSLIKKVDVMFTDGKDILLLAEEIMFKFKDQIIEKALENEVEERDYQIIDNLYKALNNMKLSDNPKMFLELSLIKCANLYKDSKSLSIIKKELDSKKTEVAIEIEDKIENVIESEKKANKNIAMQEKKSLIDEQIANRINNTFATANKNVLNSLKETNVEMAQYINNKEFATQVSYLIDANIRVAGEKNIIISLKYDSMVENANNSLEKIENLFSLMYGKYFKIAFVSDAKWKELKEEYVNNVKQGHNYIYKEETPIIVSEDSEENEMVEKAIDLFGQDLVEVQ